MADLFVELSALHVLEDEDDAIVLFVDFVDVDDARVVEFDEHVDFVAGFEEERFVDFGSEDLAGVSADDFADGGLGAVLIGREVRPRTYFSS